MTRPRIAQALRLPNAMYRRFHRAKRLQVPENIILLFQPPHCLELNPIERLWLYLKRDLRWSLFEDLPQLQTKVD